MGFVKVGLQDLAFGFSWEMGAHFHSWLTCHPKTTQKSSAGSSCGDEDWNRRLATMIRDMLVVFESLCSYNSRRNMMNHRRFFYMNGMTGWMHNMYDYVGSCMCRYAAIGSAQFFSPKMARKTTRHCSLQSGGWIYSRSACRTCNSGSGRSRHHWYRGWFAISKNRVPSQPVARLLPQDNWEYEGIKTCGLQFFMKWRLAPCHFKVRYIRLDGCIIELPLSRQKMPCQVTHSETKPLAQIMLQMRMASIAFLCG